MRKRLAGVHGHLLQKNETSAAMLSTTTVAPTDLDGDGIPNWDYSTAEELLDLYVDYNKGLIDETPGKAFAKKVPKV